MLFCKSLKMLIEQALAFIKLGWAVFPVQANGKKPLTKNGFKDATISAYTARKMWEAHPDANIGVATGLSSGIAVVDVDVKNGVRGRESLASIKGVSPTLTVTTPSGGWHLYYLCPEEGLRSKNGLLPGIDIKADGGYVVGPGSTIGGKPYEWIDPEASISAMPEAILALMRNGNGSRTNAPPSQITDVIPEGARNGTLASLAGAMRRKGMAREEISTALLAVNARRCSPPLPDKEVEAIAGSIARYEPEPGDPPGETQPVSAAGPPADAEDDEPRPPGFSDDALALAFTARHAEDWRYVAGWGHWLTWDGARWLRETTLKAFDLSRRICREAAARCQHPKIAAKVAGATTVAAVERLARADRGHAATAEQWDTDPWLFDTAGGIAAIKTKEENS